MSGLYVTKVTSIKNSVVADRLNEARQGGSSLAGKRRLYQ